MDAAFLTSFLSPFLPFLVEPVQAVSTSTFEIFDQAIWEQAQMVWEKLSPKISVKEAAKEAVTDVARHPDDEDLRVSLRVQLKKLLAQDPDLADELVIAMQPVLL